MENNPLFTQVTLPQAPRSNTPIKTPSSIGPYKIDSLLSKGSLSVLYLGIDTATKSTRVIKVLSPALFAGEDDSETLKAVKEQFLKESEILKMSDHPNIVKLYGQGEWEHGLYIAMEFIQGVSLKQFILQKSLSTKRSLEIILQVGYALMHLHSHGIIHRDLKPENILITESGSVKVIDFSIARVLEEQVKGLKGSLIGTPTYMSPEQKKDPSKATYASDIYSLGIITYELLIGKLCSGKIDLKLVPKRLHQFITKALATSLDQRYQKVEELIADLSILITESHDEAEDSSEFLDLLRDAHNLLLPKELPNWQYHEIGLSITQNPYNLDLYYDFFSLANQMKVILIAKTPFANPTSLVRLSLLKTCFKTVVKPFLESSEETFEPTAIASTLNEMCHYDSCKPRLAFAMLTLDPHSESFSFINFGFHSLWLLPGESNTPHILSNELPLLGQTIDLDILEMQDRWSEGDVLLLHTFNSKLQKDQPIENLDTLLKKSFVEILELSSKAQAENILTILCENLPKNRTNHSHLVLNIEKLG